MISHAVKSSHIDHVDYDESDNTLHVHFKDDARTHVIYDGVTASDYIEFINAKSPGKHLHDNIKGKYSFRYA